MSLPRLPLSLVTGDQWADGELGEGDGGDERLGGQHCGV